MKKQLKCIQVDKGSEYKGEYKDLFENYCRDYGIGLRKIFLKYLNIMELPKK